MTKEEFIEGYCRRSNITWDVLKDHLVALPCRCGDSSCDGWSMVNKDPFCVRVYQELYGERIPFVDVKTQEDKDG